MTFWTPGTVKAYCDRRVDGAHAALAGIMQLHKADLDVNDAMTKNQAEDILRLTNKMWGVPGIGDGLDDQLAVAQSRIAGAHKRIDGLVTELNICLGVVGTGFASIAVLFATGVLRIHT